MQPSQGSQKNPFFCHEVSWQENATQQSQKVMNQATEHGLMHRLSVPIYSDSGQLLCVTMGGKDLVIPTRERQALHMMSLYMHYKANSLIAPFMLHEQPRKISINTKRKRMS